MKGKTTTKDDVIRLEAGWLPMDERNLVPRKPCEIHVVELYTLIKGIRKIKGIRICEINSLDLLLQFSY